MSTHPFDRLLARGAQPCVIGAVLAAIGAGPAAAQTVQNTTAHIVEGDLPGIVDASPGAMMVDTRGDDNNHVWFVTRVPMAGPPRVFRLTPPGSLLKAMAQWTSWDLDEESGTSGGLKKIKGSRDRRFVFVRSATSLQRIDTQSCDASTCQRTTWIDQDPFNVSDLTVDDWNNVFTTAAVTDDPTSDPHPSQRYGQILVTGAP